MSHVVAPIAAATASSTETGLLPDIPSPYSASRTHDGSIGTGWASDGGDIANPQWVQYDYGIGQKPTLWRVRPHPENQALSATIELRASNDVAFGTSTTFATITSFSSSDWHSEALTVPTPYRYWRVYRTTTGSRASFMEHELYVGVTYTDPDPGGSFHPVQLPQNYSYSTKKQMAAKVVNFAADSGDPYAFPLNRPTFLYDVFYGKRTHSQRGQLRRFYLCRLGEMYVFKFRDNEDFTSAVDGISDPAMTHQQIAQIGSQYFLAKNYGVYTRIIHLPSEVIVSYNGYDASSQCDINTLTGEVTGYTPADVSLFKAGFEFDIPVRFSTRFSPTWFDWNAVDISLGLVEVLEDLVDPV